MKINRLLLVASSLFLLASCGGHGSDITQEQANVKIDEAKKKVSDPNYEFPKAFNFTVDTTTRGNGEEVKTTTKASVDIDKEQLYIKNIVKNETSEYWVYKDGDAYYSALYTAKSKNKNPILPAAVKTTIWATFTSSKSSMSEIYTYMAEAINTSVKYGSSVSLPEGSAVKKNELKLQSKGEGHLYVKLDAAAEIKYEEGADTQNVVYELEFENYLPVMESVNMTTTGTNPYELIVKASFDWSKAAYPGNPA